MLFANWNLDSFFGRLDWAVPYCLALAFILPLEIVFGGWKSSSLHFALQKSRTHLFDLMSFLFFLFGIHRLLADLFFLGFFSVISRFIFEKSLLEYFQLSPPVVLEFLLAFLLKDFLLYWSHRWKHSSPLLWKVHEFHHSSTKLTWFTSFRVHPLDLLFSTSLVYLPLQLVFGWEILEMFWFSVATSILGKLTHSRLDWGFGFLGRWLIVSPRAHHLHHEIEANSGRNFGDSLILWDRMFGTYTAPKQSIERIRQGIPENFYESDSIVIAYLRPVKEFYENLFRWNFFRRRTFR